MAASKGPNLLIKRGDGASPEVFTTVGAMRTKALRVNSEPIDVTTDDDISGGASWRTSLAGINSLSLSGDGIAKSIEPVGSMQEDQIAGTVTNYEIVVPNIGTFEAAMVITELSYDAPYDGVVSFNLSMENNQAATFTKETV